MLRIVDANLNRIGEGLRVLEEVSRFMLNDAALSHDLKELRHSLTTLSPEFQSQLLAARAAGEDVAAFNSVPGEQVRSGPTAVVRANARRVQESLRVLEEFSKVDGVKGDVDTESIKKARFRLYDLEKRIVLGLAARED